MSKRDNKIESKTSPNNKRGKGADGSVKEENEQEYNGSETEELSDYNEEDERRSKDTIKKEEMKKNIERARKILKKVLSEDLFTNTPKGSPKTTSSSAMLNKTQSRGQE